MHRTIGALILAFGLVLTCPSAGHASSQTETPHAFEAEIQRSKKSMMSDPAIALSAAQKAETAARMGFEPDDQDMPLATALWLQGEALNRLNRVADAAPVIDRALAMIAHNPVETKLKGDLLLAQGSIAKNRSDDDRALKSFHQAHDVFARLGQTRNQALALQRLGSIYQDAHAYDRVLDYYLRAAEVHAGDRAIDLSSYNNRANAYREMGEYAKAVTLFEKAAEVADALESPLLKARITANIATTYLSDGQPEVALRYADEAIEYLQISEPGEWGPVIYGVHAQVIAGLGREIEAASLFDAVFSGIEFSKSTAPFRDLHESAYVAYRKVGKLDLALKHHEAFKRLDDAGRDIAASANNVLVAAEFDFAAQNLEIEQLASAQLRNTLALKNAQARQQRITLIAIAVVILLLTTGLIWGLVTSQASQNRIAAANERLQKSNAALDLANKAKTAFLATTSHEIRTPLNGILGLTEVILRDEVLSEVARERVQQVRGAGDTLLAVVNDILDVATIESGQFEIVETETDLSSLVKDAVGLFDEEASTKGLALSMDIGDCPDVILSDPMRLRQVLFNLLSNAIKFTHQGAVKISLSTQTTRQGEFLSIKVADTGIGIPASELEAIFSAFHQVDGSVGRRFGGTGLGLSICRQIATALGGDMAVSSVLGEGSQFNVLIPLKRPIITNDGATPRVRGETRAMSELDVLVVEDNILNRTVVKALVEKHVASITLAEDGVQGLAAMREKHFDIILMDKQMPNMDGLTAIRTIRAMNNGDETIYIVAVTADAYDGAREELIDAGVDDYLAKPVCAENLLNALQRGIDVGLRHSKVNAAA